MDEIVWEEPLRLRAVSKWGPILAELRKRPGVWGRVPGEHNPSVGFNIRRGLVAGAAAGEFDARCQTIPGSNRHHVYVRYVGDAS